MRAIATVVSMALAAGCGAPALMAEPIEPAAPEKPAVGAAIPIEAALTRAGSDAAAPCPDTDGPGPLVGMLGHPLAGDGAARCLEEAADPGTADAIAEALVAGDEPPGRLLVTVLLWKDELDDVDEPFREGVAAAALEKVASDPGVIDALVGVIEGGIWKDPTIHGMAIEWAARGALTKAGEAAVGPLMEVIADEDSPGASDAVIVLGMLGGAAFESLAQGTLSGSKELRANCAYALGIGKDPRAVNVLLPLLGDPEPLVRAWAATALGKIGDKAAIGPLAKALGDPDSGVVYCATGALAAMGGDEALAALEAAMGDGRKEVRLAAISALEQIGTEAAAKAIAAAMKDEDESIGMEAFKALCKADPGDKGTLKAARKALASPNAETRAGGVRCLFAIGSEAAGKALVGAIDDQDQEVAGLAIEALKRMKYEPAVGPLLDAVLEAVEGGDHDFVSVELMAIAEIGGPADPKKAVAALEKVEPGQRMSLHVPLVAAGKKAVKPVVKLLGSEDPAIRAEAAKILGKIGDASCKGPLVKALGDEPVVAAAAVVGLGGLGDASVEGDVLAMAAHEDDGVRAAACKALGMMGGEAAREALVRALGDDSIAVRSAAAKALGHVPGPGAVEALIAALGGPSIDVSAAAAAALGEIGDAAAVEPLIALLEPCTGGGTGADAGWIRNVAARALGEIGDASAVPALVPLLGNEEDMLVADAATALGEIGDRAATPALMAALEAHVAGFYCVDGFDPLTGMGFGSCTHWTTASILGALAKIGDPSALDLVMEFIHDPDPEASKAAKELVEKVGGPWHQKKIGVLEDGGE